MGGFGIFSNRDQRSIFWVLNFQNLYFLGTSQSSRMFGVIKKYAVFLSVLYFLQYFLGLDLFIHQVLQ